MRRPKVTPAISDIYAATGNLSANHDFALAVQGFIGSTGAFGVLINET
jgi:hypothetical protein